MKTIKLIVTHKGQLSKKYDANELKSIAKAISSLIAKDKVRGIDTHFVHLDDAVVMAKYKVQPVAGAISASKCKQAIDSLFLALSPDYLVLLGAGDVIPFFEVPNPSFSQTSGDDDQTVPTDNPYACSKSFSKTNRKSYLVPDRVVGRIPDLPGSNPDVAWLLDYLKVAEAWKLEEAKAFADDLIVCCDEWKAAGLDCAAHVSRKADRLIISPPVKTTAPGALSGRYATRFHMIKCHGAPMDSHFYGQKGESYPEVIHSKLLKGKTVKGSVVGAMCCYGASTFDPDHAAVVEKGEAPIPSLYLRQGAYGFFGSTTIAWVGSTNMQCADWIVASALKNVLSGASLGRALLDSKQNFVKWIDQQGKTPDIAEEKTLIQFVLLGDPSIHIVPAKTNDGPVPASMSFTASISRQGTAEERRLRRTAAHNNGEQLRTTLPQRKVVSRTPDSVKRAMASVKKEKMFKDFDFGNLIAHEVIRPFTQPELTTAAMRGVTAAFSRSTAPIARKETFEYYLFARKKVGKKGIVNARMVKLETDKDGAILRTRMLVSS